MFPLTRRSSGLPLLKRRAFTLAELLVVLALVGVLVALLLPGLMSMRRQSKAVKCLNNLRQLATALQLYASDYQGHLPPNVSKPGAGLWWHDQERIGRYLSRAGEDQPSPEIGVLRCPEDPGASRSYAMNAWASSLLDRGILAGREDQMWRRGVKDSARMILLADTWSFRGSADDGWVSPPLMGATRATPGRRFGALGGTVIARFSRVGPINCELAYPRHGVTSRLSHHNPVKGRISIAYADGHVALKSHEELVDVKTGRSRFDSLWTPADHQVEH